MDLPQSRERSHVSKRDQDRRLGRKDTPRRRREGRRSRDRTAQYTMHRRPRGTTATVTSSDLGVIHQCAESRDRTI